MTYYSVKPMDGGEYTAHRMFSARLGACEVTAGLKRMGCKVFSHGCIIVNDGPLNGDQLTYANGLLGEYGLKLEASH